jgi:hypothetical protein
VRRYQASPRSSNSGDAAAWTRPQKRLDRVLILFHGFQCGIPGWRQTHARVQSDFLTVARRLYFDSTLSGLKLIRGTSAGRALLRLAAHLFGCHFRTGNLPDSHEDNYLNSYYISTIVILVHSSCGIIIYTYGI